MSIRFTLMLLTSAAYAGGSNRKQAIANAPIDSHDTYMLGVPFPQALAGVFLGMMLVGIAFMGIRKSDRRQEERRLEAIFSFFRQVTLAPKGRENVDRDIESAKGARDCLSQQGDFQKTYDANVASPGRRDDAPPAEPSGSRTNGHGQQHHTKTRLFGKKRKPEALETVKVLASSCDSGTKFM